MACGDFFVNDEEVKPEKVGFDIYPNPTSSSCSMRFNLGQSTAGEVKVFDAVGRQIQSLQLSSSSNHLEINGLSAGVNYVVLLMGGVMIQSKMVVRN
ncbi:MAG: T9SS type A sorting domain-containing protein [Saprospiraceae bacterium]|nr:T9SS type A sorting domain-containing protein [Saprospiraceae bacterium]MCF8248852.1 T9SS type A sorting domain-containing protein [Saprospiraceae bacterium]MCF8279577.1 T9SS type A sorting domain-containing protein [Bacteroidales bacterium]MCF8310137.1 T9SS type A sorting domain-containing protein [Saprospiraceae bacterium]MCF8439037.1 T9SS type A sorting domain-containing protein [Saprospiraceae bacterium]